jgi:hypothetical protein
LCNSEEEARRGVLELSKKGYWPCYFFESDTTGEKDFEEFYTDTELLDMERFSTIGIVKNTLSVDFNQLAIFEEKLRSLKSTKSWVKRDIANLFFQMLPNFDHKETGKYLDDKM